MKISVKAVCKNNQRTPCHFPWRNGVHLFLQGDCSDLLNLQTEIEVVKQEVNRDANRFGLALKDLNITIKFI